MANVIAFRGEGNRNPAPARPLPIAGAEIVIFPGIRYEYHADPAARDTAERTRTRKRDRLEITD
jgi:hypothetical protein